MSAPPTAPAPAAGKPGPTAGKPPRGGTFARFLVLCGMGFVISIPFVWMVSASFKPREEVEEIRIVPEKPTLRNYPVVLDVIPDPGTGKFLELRFGRWYFNSIFLAAGITVLQVLTSAMAAYAFSRMHWRGRDRVFLAYETDLQGSHSRTEVTELSDTAYRESYTVRLTNRKRAEVPVTVVEHHHGAWSVVTSSHKYDKKETALEFPVVVPAESEVIIEYTVLFRT